MPTVYTGSYKIPMEAGKGLGQIAGEKESYTRGVEQARLDMQKKQIADAQMIRKLARIDAEEKETRRQLEWDAVQKRQSEQFKTAQEGTQKRWEEMTPYQKSVEGRLKSAEQRKIDAQKENEEMLRRVSLGESTFQPAGATGGYDLRTQQPTVQQEQAPTPVQKSLQEQYHEGLKKQIITIDAEYKKKLRVKAVSDVYNPKASASQNEMRIKSKYNELLKTAKEKNTEANLKLISAKSKIEVAKQKAEKANQKEKKAIEKEMKKAGNPTQAQITLAKQALSTGGLGTGYTAEEMEKHTKWAKGIQSRVIAMGGAVQAGTEQVFGAEQEKLIQNNIQAYGKSREEVIKAMQAQGLL